MAENKQRRQYGTGSIQELADGRWVGVFDAGFTASGKRRRLKVTGKTKAEVRTKLKNRMREHESNRAGAEQDPRKTVKAWSTEWLEITKAHVRPKPWGTDRSAVNKWIVPTIGHVRLRDLTPTDLRAVHRVMGEAGRTTSTIRRTHMTIIAMLKAAAIEGYPIAENLFKAKKPTPSVHDRDAMPLAHSLRILAAASHLPHGSRWMFALYNGERQGECLGLTWDCVDLEAGLVTIEWQLQALPYNVARDRDSGFRIPDGYEARQLEGRLHLVRPKTKAGYRVSPMVPAMVEALRQWQEVAPENEHGLVWATSTGRPIVDNDDRQEWYRIQKQLGIEHRAGRPYYCHEARHTTATELLAAGADPHEITQLIGHSSVLVTRGYQHPSQRASLATLELLAARFEQTEDVA